MQRLVDFRLEMATKKNFSGGQPYLLLTTEVVRPLLSFYHYFVFVDYMVIQSFHMFSAMTNVCNVFGNKFQNSLYTVFKRFKPNVRWDLHKGHPHPNDVPGEVEADLGIGIVIDVVLQHVQPLNLHEQVTGLMLSIVRHIVGHDLLHQLEQRVLLGLVALLHLLPLLGHLAGQVPGRTRRISKKQLLGGKEMPFRYVNDDMHLHTTSNPKRNPSQIFSFPTEFSAVIPSLHYRCEPAKSTIKKSICISPICHFCYKQLWI